MNPGAATDTSARVSPGLMCLAMASAMARGLLRAARASFKGRLTA